MHQTMLQLQLNSTVVLSKGLTGERYFTFRNTAATSKKQVEEAAIDVISRFECVPQRCVHLVWAKEDALQYNVSVVLKKMQGFEFDSVTERNKLQRMSSMKIV